MNEFETLGVKPGMITIKYQRGREKCPCGGEITYGSRMSDKLPVGFGFVGYRFQIDVIKRTGFGGDCMTCGAKVFAVQSRRHVTTYPKLKGADATHKLKREFLNGCKTSVV